MDKEKQEVLKNYMKFRGLKNHSPSLKDIEFHIKKFLKSNKQPLSAYNTQTLVDYLDKIKSKYKTGMLNKIKGDYLKNFIKNNFEDCSNRFRNLDIILRSEKTEATYKPEDMITEEEFAKMIKMEQNPFWKAYFLTFFYGGCRPVEVCKLMRKDVEFDNDGGAFITVFSNKNKTSFIKYLPTDTAFYLKKLMENHASEWVFLNEKTNAPITKKGAYFRIRKLSEKALGKRIDLYTLRHSIATIIYNKDIKDDDIARQMGHTKSMKIKYVHNHKGKLKEMARAIYKLPEDLPPEKKHKLEKEIEQLKADFSKMEEMLINHANKFMPYIIDAERKRIIKVAPKFKKDLEESNKRDLEELHKSYEIMKAK